MWLVLHAKGICFKASPTPTQPSNQIFPIFQDLAASFLPRETLLHPLPLCDGSSLRVKPEPLSLHVMSCRLFFGKIKPSLLSCVIQLFRHPDRSVLSL